MSMFREKPIVIEARQATGTSENFRELRKWLSTHDCRVWPTLTPTGRCLFFRDTEGDDIEGDLRANIGDWIIKGVKGEFYPCKPDIFVATYDPMEVPS